MVSSVFERDLSTKTRLGALVSSVPVNSRARKSDVPKKNSRLAFFFSGVLCSLFCWILGPTSSWRVKVNQATYTQASLPGFIGSLLPPPPFQDLLQ